MGQRTQVVVHVKYAHGESKTFAFHNQRGFGRPLVSSTINIVNETLKLINSDSLSYYMGENWLRARVSIVNNEYFRHAETYECKFPFDFQDHDNNDGRSEIVIDIDKKTIEYKIFGIDYDEDDQPYGKSMDDLEYIKYVGAINFCDTERREWHIETKESILSLTNKINDGSND